MEANTDFAAVKTLLESIYSEVNDNRDLSIIMKDAQWLDGVKITRIDEPTTWRLVKGPDGDEEEMIFTVRGIILGKDLPPVLQRPRISAGRYKYLRQSVTISGLGIASFDQALAAAREIYGLFDRTFPDGQLGSWMSSSSTFIGDLPGIDASNRYMVPKKDAPAEHHQAFGTSVDPKGLLEDMALESECIHTEDNKVLYFSSRANGTSQRIFSDAHPQVFRNGDIVELQISFIVVPLKGEKYKMLTCLHSIALLDGTFGQSASKTRSAQRPVTVAPKTLLSIKRRVGYAPPDSVQSGDGEEKRARMDVDEGASELSNNFSTHL